ncbi:MAG: dienelactone hydrolase family protein [Betaproteobacteria bacterium]|nr:dienelactone hydrolase family protein [Betaproteobacteria bacterium]
MNGKTTTVKASDGGAFGAYLSLPPGGSGPGVVMISEIFGVNATIRKNADRFAGQGYVVLAPDLYRHLEPGLELGYDEPSRQKALALHGRLDYEGCVADMGDAVRYLRGLDQCGGPVFVTGFCLGGTMSYLAAARLKIDAASGYYPTRIQNYLGDASKIHCPLLLHFGREDHLTPPETISSILHATEGNPNVTSVIYEAGHQFANPDRPDLYIEAAAVLAHQRTFELFNQVAASAGRGSPKPDAARAARR